MPRQQFEQDLQDLKDELLLLSSMSAECGSSGGQSHAGNGY